MKYTGKYLLVLALAGMALLAHLTSASATVKSGGVDIDQLALKAAAFSGRSSVRLAPSESEVWVGLGPLMAYDDVDSGDEYLVDTSSGVIRRYASASGYAGFGAGGGFMPRDGLLQKAQRLAESTYEGGQGQVAAMDCTTEQVVVSEVPVLAAKFIVEYRESKNGVSTFNHVRVELDASTGAVLSVEQDYATLDVELVPTVGEAEAIQLSLAECNGVPESCVKDIRLVAVRALDGTQHLAWHAVVETGTEEFGAHMDVLVDAMTGESLLDEEG
ncbi:MAG: hypothetical protein JXA58_08070 [Dehalococcoidia bacterium]|nr:hypothetical protein [Dehalococcoidia bacterium]